MLYLEYIKQLGIYMPKDAGTIFVPGLHRHVKVSEIANINLEVYIEDAKKRATMNQNRVNARYLLSYSPLSTLAKTSSC